MANAIEARGLRKRFGKAMALDGLDLTVRTGEVHAFLGPNGAGKTTTIRVLLGLLRKDGGDAVLLGGDPWRDATTLHSRLAYVPGDVTLWPAMTGGEIIDLMARLRGGRHDKTRRRELIERFDLDPSKKARSYSKGNRQKVSLISAFSSRARLLLLDEPSSGLDPLMENIFQQCVAEARDRGATVLLSSHILAETERLCQRVTIIRAGRTVESGTLESMRHLSRTTITADAPRLTADDIAEVLQVSPAAVSGAVRYLLPLGLVTRETEPGKGNRQKVALIAALASDAELLVFDEPTSGLDPLMEVAFQECVNAERHVGRTVLLSSHILAEAEALADRVTIIRAGRSVETGTLADLRHLTRTTIDAELDGPIAADSHAERHVGRTVLLSSHILAEAEALADRVTIIRAGRSVETGTLADLRHLTRTTIDAELDGPIAADSLPGVHDAVINGTRLRCEVDNAALTEVLRRLAATGVRTLTCRPPTLEELFLRHYEGQDHDDPERVRVTPSR